MSYDPPVVPAAVRRHSASRSPYSLPPASTPPTPGNPPPRPTRRQARTPRRPRPPQRPADPAQRLPVAAARRHPHRARLLHPLPHPVRVRPGVHVERGRRRTAHGPAARAGPTAGHLAGDRAVRAHRPAPVDPLADRIRDPQLNASGTRQQDAARPSPPLARRGRGRYDSGRPRPCPWSAFIAVTTVTLLLCVMTGPDRDDLDEFYTGYRSLSPMQNGLAIAGDYISAATVLGTIGVIALFGYDGARPRPQHRAVAGAADVPAGRTPAQRGPVHDGRRPHPADAGPRRAHHRLRGDPRRAAAADARPARGRRRAAGLRPRLLRRRLEDRLHRGRSAC